MRKITRAFAIFVAGVSSLNSHKLEQKFENLIEVGSLWQNLVPTVGISFGNGTQQNWTIDINAISSAGFASLCTQSVQGFNASC
jgi:hypothetical protein